MQFLPGSVINITTTNHHTLIEMTFARSRHLLRQLPDVLRRVPWHPTESLLDIEAKPPGLGGAAGGGIAAALKGRLPKAQLRKNRAPTLGTSIGFCFPFHGLPSSYLRSPNACMNKLYVRSPCDLRLAWRNGMTRCRPLFCSFSQALG